MYHISIDARENELSDGVKHANNSCGKIISPGKLWKISLQPITKINEDYNQICKLIVEKTGLHMYQLLNCNQFLLY
jgi:hypothetical protein